MSSDDLENLTQSLASLSVQNEELVSEKGYDPSVPSDIPSFAPLMTEENGLEEEVISSITLADNNFLRTEFEKDQFESMYLRANKWCSDAGVTDEEVAETKEKYLNHLNEFINRPDVEFDRIFVRDSERSYNTRPHRVALCHVLTYLKEHHLEGDYHQGLSMLISFLMFFLETPKVIAMAVRAATQERFVPKVWRSQSVAAATDGYVFDALLQEHFPTIYSHVKSIGLIPELYIYKYWCGMSIHVLPYQSLVRMLDEFWGELGVLALFKVNFVTFVSQQQEIMACRTMDKLLERLRFDPLVVGFSEVNNFVYEIDTPAKLEEQKWRDSIDKIIHDLKSTGKLASLRSAAYDKHLRTRMERAAETTKAEEVTIPACAKEGCEDADLKGDYFCLDCKIHLCEDCAYSTWGEHDDNEHDVRTNEDIDA